MITVVSYDIVFLLVNMGFFILTGETLYQDSERLEKIKEIKKTRKEMKRTIMMDKYVYFQFIIQWIVLLAIVALSIIYPAFSIILCMVFPLFFALINIFKDKNKIRIGQFDEESYRDRK